MNGIKPRLIFVALVVGILTLTHCSFNSFGLRFSEPEVRGAIINKLTKKPVHGALVYGFYATEIGQYHGTRITGYVHNFEVQTDENGRFTLPAWGSNDLFQWGTAHEKFPVLYIYAPGYQTFASSFTSIRDWRPSDAAYNAKHANKMFGIVDWTDYPVELTPVTSERDRFNALRLSSGGEGGGDCAWETYSRLTQIQHWERKAFIKRNVPAEFLTTREYARDNYLHPNPHINGLSNNTGLDSLVEYYEQLKRTGQLSQWKCADPTLVFRS
jgi:hypothetical protein